VLFEPASGMLLTTAGSPGNTENTCVTIFAGIQSNKNFQSGC
jgi:hypothetical protein